MVESAGWTSGVLAGSWAQDCKQGEPEEAEASAWFAAFQGEG